MVKIHLSRILGERRLSQAELARGTGIRASTIGDWYHELIERINLDHLDLRCDFLNVSISEMLEQIPNKEKLKKD